MLISNLSEAGRDPSAPINATYIGMEALNDDYVEFEKQYFREQHKNKYWWDLSEIVDRLIMHINLLHIPFLKSIKKIMVQFGRD